MAIAGLLEQHQSLKSFSTSGKELIATFYPNEKIPSLDNSEIYLYHINPLPNEGWERVGNKQNVSFSEFKTESTIKYSKLEKINVLKWLDKNGYVLSVKQG
jgi:hypothetical protein